MGQSRAPVEAMASEPDLGAGPCRFARIAVGTPAPCPAAAPGCPFALRLEPPARVLHHVTLRRTERQSLVFAPWVLPQAISAAARR